MARQLEPRLHFADVTAGAGIEFTMTCGRNPAQEILEVNGGGLGLIDFDNDGDLDLFIANGATLDDPENGPGCRLYENLAIDDQPGAPQSSVRQIRFRDVTAKSGINVRRWAMGVAVGDFNGDRFDDIYIACYGPNILLRNNGDGTFADATSAAFAIDADAQIANRRSPEWSASAAFGDIDNDGDLDLYVCNYLEFDWRNPPPRAKYKEIEVMAGPHGLTPQHDVLYLNQGDGTFIDITEASGCRAARPSFGLNAVIVDFDGDGWQDITVANDSMPDFLFLNKTKASSRNGEVLEASMPQTLIPRFEEVGVISGISANADGGNQASMGLAIADVDGNGLPDKFTTVFSSDTNALHMNMTQEKASRDQGIKASSEGSMPLFEDRAQQYGLGMISRPYLGWSTAFYDFDHDGDEDLFMVNGHVYPQATLQTMDSEFQQPPLLFERTARRFSRVKPERAGEWLAQPHRDRNAVFGDFDLDGDIDIIIGELNGPIRVLRNDAQAPASFLIVELKDERPHVHNHRGLGSKIELIAIEANKPRSADNESRTPNAEAVTTSQSRWLFTGGGFQSSGAPAVHFGLGHLAPEAKLRLRITWPGGEEQIIENVAPNQRVTVRRN